MIKFKPIAQMITYSPLEIILKTVQSAVQYWPQSNTRFDATCMIQRHSVFFPQILQCDLTVALRHSARVQYRNRLRKTSQNSHGTRVLHQHAMYGVLQLQCRKHASLPAETTWGLRIHGSCSCFHYSIGRTSTSERDTMRWRPSVWRSNAIPISTALLA